MKRYTLQEVSLLLGLGIKQSRNLVKRRLASGIDWEYEQIGTNVVIMVKEDAVERLKVRPKPGRVPKSELV